MALYPCPPISGLARNGHTCENPQPHPCLGHDGAGCVSPATKSSLDLPAGSNQPPLGASERREYTLTVTDP
jgi:hypothetical protein